MVMLKKNRSWRYKWGYLNIKWMHWNTVVLHIYFFLRLNPPDNHFILLTQFDLTLSWRRPLSYRDQSIDLLRKSMDWFLYDNGLRHGRVKRNECWWTESFSSWLEVPYRLTIPKSYFVTDVFEHFNKAIIETIIEQTPLSLLTNKLFISASK